MPIYYLTVTVGQKARHDRAEFSALGLPKLKGAGQAACFPRAWSPLPRSGRCRQYSISLSCRSEASIFLLVISWVLLSAPKD